MDTPTDGNSSNEFATIPDVPIPTDSQRVSPNDVASGVGRGTQIVVGSDSSQITFGVVPGATQLGMAEYNPTGQKVLQMGQQSDGSNALKFFDANGIGIAQFGEFPDGTTALKVAKTGIEVSTAPNTDLIFNSGQNIFKIADTGTCIVPVMTAATSGGPAGGSAITATTTVSKDVEPLMFLAFGNVDNFPNDAFPFPIISAGGQSSTFGGYIGHMWTANSDDDGTNITLIFEGINYRSTTISTLNVRWYLLQETAQA